MRTGEKNKSASPARPSGIKDAFFYNSKPKDLLLVVVLEWENSALQADLEKHNFRLYQISRSASGLFFSFTRPTTGLFGRRSGSDRRKFMTDARNILCRAGWMNELREIGSCN